MSSQPEPQTPLLRVRQLHKRYAGHSALQGLDFELRGGEVLGLLGANGAGKTTALQMICGALAPSGGEIAICGQDLRNAPLAAKRQLGYLPDQPPLYPELTVDEYLRHCARLHRVARGDSAAAVAAALEDCNLGAVRRRLIGNLSKGYRQRVGLAGALVHRPRLLVFDEPTTGLDPLQIGELRALIADICGGDSGRAAILSSHLMQEVAATCTRVLVLHRGRSLCDAPLADFAASGWLRARLPGAVDAAQLAALPAIREVRRDAGGWRLLPAAPGDDGAAAVAREIVTAGIPLAALGAEENTLEARFTELVRGAEAQLAATEATGGDRGAAA